MSEQLGEQRIDLGLELAHASNVAFDEIKDIEAKMAALDTASQLPDVTVGDKARVRLEHARFGAEAHFNMFVDAAGALIGSNQPDSGELFGSKEETVVEPVEIEIPEALNGLNASYLADVVSRYADIRRATELKVATGDLPETVERPDLAKLAERVVALAPTFEAMDQKGYEPVVVFVPKGLTFEQWHGVMYNYELPDGSKSEGVWRSWDDYADTMTDPTGSETSDEAWDVAVVNGTERPAFVNVSPDGKNGSNAKATIKELAELPSVAGKTTAELVKQLSPAQDTYFALQLARFIRGEAPVDPQTRTIGKENVKVDRTLLSLSFDFHPDSRQVRSVWYYLDSSTGGGGVRPSVRGQDLVLEPQS
ncbi:hypothetical protein HY441_01565 [Candidatus Microgenomates bacterium]|nr:hypothetical protein [Candidatus Microgenomates bacterium]